MDCKHLSLLMTATVGYLVVGMFLFRALEQNNEIITRHRMRQELLEFIENRTCVNIEDMQNILKLIGIDVGLAHLVFANISTADVLRWDLFGSMSYALTVITTIGYGHMPPFTALGKMSTVLYALLGIPLALIMLKGIGDKLHGVSKKLHRVRCFKKPRLNRFFNAFLVVLVGVNFILFLPAWLFQAIEGWTMVESLYYCFITLSTIGFGDILPAARDLNRTEVHFYRTFIYIWIFLGLAYISLIISIISNTIVEKARVVERKTLTKLEVELRKLRRDLKFKKHLPKTSWDAVKDSADVDVRLLHYHSKLLVNDAFTDSADDKQAVDRVAVDGDHISDKTTITSCSVGVNGLTSENRTPGTGSAPVTGEINAVSDSIFTISDPVRDPIADIPTPDRFDFNN